MTDIEPVFESTTAVAPLSQERPAEPSEESEIAGQMATIKAAIEMLLMERAPVTLLKPGQLHRRVAESLKKSGFNSLEIPSRSTFDRFRRGYGRRYGLR